MSKGGLGHLEAFGMDWVGIEQWLELFEVQYALKKKDEWEKPKLCRVALGFQAAEALSLVLPQRYLQ